MTHPDTTRLQQAVWRLEDILKDDDGQAWKEASKFLERLKKEQREEAQPRADALDAELLNFLKDQSIDLRCFNSSDGEDVGWRTVQHHMSEPRERVVSEVYGDQPRRAIREAMARIERDPYCTGPLHLEDDAAIAAAKENK